MRIRSPFVAGIVKVLTLSFISTPAVGAPVLNDRMGVATHYGLGSNYRVAWNVEKTLPLVVDLGVGWIRDEIYWREYERERGSYALPAHSTRWIDAAHRAGLKIILIFNIERKGNPAHDDPFDPDAYARAAAQLSLDLGGKVQVIEVLNEPNNFGFSQHHGGTWNGWDGKGKESPWIASYVTLLNKAADAIKVANPHMKVIGAGAPTPANFRMIARGISPRVDGIVDHPYSFRTVPELVPFSARDGILDRDGFATADERGTFASQIRMYREHSARHKGPKELWLTEWGFPIHQEAKARTYAGRTPEAQAKYALRRFAETFGLGVEMSVYYDFKDDGLDIYNAEHNFGLMTYDLDPKPVYHAVQRLARFMSPWQPVTEPVEVNVFLPDTRPDQWPITWDGTRQASNGSILNYAFKDGHGGAMILIWSSERAGGDLQPRLGDIEIAWPTNRPPPSEIKIFDLWTGDKRKTKVEAKAGRLWLPRVTIPDYPVALLLGAR